MKLLRIQTILVLVLTLMSSVPILGFGLIQAFRWRDFTKSTDEGRAVAQVQALHQEIQRVVEIRLSALELMAEQIRVQSKNKPLKPDPSYYSLLQLYVEKFEMSVAGLVDLNGDPIEFYSHKPSLRKFFIKYNVTPLGFMQPILESRDSVVTPLMNGMVSKQKLFAIATPVWDLEKKKIRAVISSSIMTEEIQRLANRIMGSTPMFRFIVLDHKKQIIAQSGLGDFFTPVQNVKSKVFEPSFSDRPEIRIGKDEEGNDVHGAVQSLHIRPGITWTMLVSQSQDSLHRQERVAWQQALLVSGLGLVLSFGVAILLSSLISRPILQLVSKMKKIESGVNTSVTPKKNKKFGFREIAEAWEALGSMTQKMSTYTENLESEVSQRTRELIRTHKELDEQRVRAVESARLASLGEMAGGIAHEINNPLSIISLITQQQQDKIARNQLTPERASEAFSRIEATTRRIAKIIQGLKAFSREGDNDPVENTTLQSVVESTLTFCHEKFKFNEVEMRLSIPNRPIEIECRSVQISQVLLNLLNNAFDAVQGLAEKWIEIRIEDRSDSVEIRVIDSGLGIAEIHHEKIFQPFFTLKGVGKGTGLGLSISRGIIEAHQGQIYVDAQSVHTTFVVRLPKKLYAFEA